MASQLAACVCCLPQASCRTDSLPGTAGAEVESSTRTRISQSSRPLGIGSEKTSLSRARCARVTTSSRALHSGSAGRLEAMSSDSAHADHARGLEFLPLLHNDDSQSLSASSPSCSLPPPGFHASLLSVLASLALAAPGACLASSPPSSLPTLSVALESEESATSVSKAADPVLASLSSAAGLAQQKENGVLVAPDLVASGGDNSLGAFCDSVENVVAWPSLTYVAAVPEENTREVFTQRVIGAVEMLEGAKRMQAQGDFEGALAGYTQVVDQHGDLALADYARVGRALMLYENGERQNAIFEMEGVSITFKGYPEVHAALAAALYTDKHLPLQAERQFSFATLLDPRYTSLDYVKSEKHWPPSLVASLKTFLTLG